MTDADELVKRIVKEADVSEEEVRKKMADRKEKTHGLLSDYGAVYAVAKEYGIELTEGETSVTPLADIQPSNSVNVIGKAKAVFSEREFTRKDGSKGKFASAVLMDTSGESRLVLWDQNAQAVKDMRVGDVVLAKNGYVKENRGEIEIHAGALTNIAINPANIAVELPEIEERIDSITALEAGLPAVNVVCRVNRYYPKTEFDRSDGSKGYRASFIAEDETGTIRVVLWDAAADADIEEGDMVKIENGYTREGLNNEVELQAGGRSRVTKTEAKLKLDPLEKRTQAGAVKIKEVKADMGGITLEARVLRVYEPREYSKGMMASMIVGDETGSIRAVLWNEQSQAANELKEGDTVRLKNAYSRANLNDEPEVHAGKYTEVTVDADLDVPTVSEINEALTVEKKISELDTNDRYVRVTGKIVDVEDKALVYMTCSECNKKVQNLGGEWMCDECGVVEGQPNMLASVIVEDDTGNVRAVAFRNNAEKLLGLDLEEAMNIIGETQDEKAPLEHAREQVLDKQVKLIGRVNYNDYSDQIEFVVDEVA